MCVCGGWGGSQTKFEKEGCKRYRSGVFIKKAVRNTLSTMVLNAATLLLVFDTEGLKYCMASCVK